MAKMKQDEMKKMSKHVKKPQDKNDIDEKTGKPKEKQEGEDMYEDPLVA